jgi:hypothetical protein
MRKTLLTLSIILLLSNSVFAQALQPQWSEFCPLEYTNANHKTLAGFIPYFRKQSNKENNYWAARKAEFIHQINNCKMISGNTEELTNCFHQLRSAELSKNNVFYNQQSLEELRRSNEIRLLRSIDPTQTKLYLYKHNINVEY